MKSALICFTRVPRPGHTKTRLLPLLSGLQCAGLHRAFLQDLQDLYRRLDLPFFVAYAPDPDWPQLQELLPSAAGFFPQQGAELGARMDHAISHVLSLGYEAAVLTGSDLPRLTAHHLQAALRALEAADVVLGPTGDGGYYLVGSRQPCPALFTAQQYGCGDVWGNTLRAAEAAGYRVAPALPCDDVDTPEDLRRLAAEADPASHTGRYLEELRKAGVPL